MKQVGKNKPDSPFMTGYGVRKTQKEMKFMLKQPNCKKDAAFKSLSEKSCEIKGGGQEMAGMMLVLVMTACVHKYIY